MEELINKLYTVLNLMKDFNSGYNSKTSSEGKMIIEYKGKRYAVFIEEMCKCEDEDAFDSIKKLKYWF